MFELNGKILVDPIIDVLYNLRKDLILAGINKLSDIIDKGANAIITCPCHKNGNETHPSCQVRLTEDPKVPLGYCRCFTCGYTARLSRMICDCFGESDITFGNNWLLTHQNFAFPTSFRSLNKLQETTRHTNTMEPKYVDENELKTYRFYHPYMFKRKLTKDVINKYDIGYDKDTNCVTFPTYDKNGRCLFVVRRNVDFKKFYIPKGVDKAIFGLYQIPKDCKELVICESVFNALTCAVYGKVGVALFGTGSKEQIETLRNLPIRKFILAFDGDEAGHNATRKFINALGKDKLIKVYKLPDGKDINDLSKEEFDALETN